MFRDQPFVYFQPFAFVLVTLFFILQGCSQNSDQREFEKAAFSEPNGITVTNEQGDVITVDPDDWRIAPFFQGDIELVTLPHPNPVRTNQVLRLDIQVNFLDRITGMYIRVLRFGSFYPVDDRNQIRIGINSFSLDAKIIAGGVPNQAGLYRLIIQDENENVITYGDIEIQ